MPQLTPLDRRPRWLSSMSSAYGVLAVAAATLFGAGSPAAFAADEPDGSGWAPAGFFVQAGHGSSRTTTGTIGLLWRPSPITRLGPGTLTYYFEASVGRWRPKNDDPDTRDVTQFGLTPVLRWQGDNRWFGEAGIGANAITPVFRAGPRRFSTVFEFGDHLGVGRTFGAANDQEVALRFQHYSNAGISHPNPGINLVELRYAHAF